MNRRNFVGSALSGVLGLAMTNNALANQAVANNSGDITNQSIAELIKPKMLKPGDTVGVIAPSTAVSDPDDYRRAKEALDYFGLKMKLGDHVQHGNGYKTRSINERLIDLHKFFADDEINAVIAIRGGYGSPQILDGIDYDLIKKHPKIFLGYSDITAMHLAIFKKAGLITFHGPVLLSAFSNYTIDYFKRALFSAEPIGVAENSKDKNTFREVFPIRTLSGGKASGRLVGGNLSLICSTLGTQYEIDTKDRILFIEDVGEEPYRIDRMLTHLKLANKLHSAKGIVVGYCKDCDYSNLQSSRIWDPSLGEVLDNIIGSLGIPAIYGLTIGHTSNQITLPLGVMAELDADAKTLNITESGVIA